MREISTEPKVGRVGGCRGWCEIPPPPHTVYDKLWNDPSVSTRQLSHLYSDCSCMSMCCHSHRFGRIRGLRDVGLTLSYAYKVQGGLFAIIQHCVAK